MATKSDHVIVRDGRPSRANQPAPVPRAVERGERHDVSAAFGGEYSKAGTAGVFPVDAATFDKIGSGRTARNDFPPSKPQPANPGDAQALSQGLPAPID